MLGVDALYERLNALGLALPQSAGWYGASLALGSADVTLLVADQRLPRARQRRRAVAGAAMALGAKADDARVGDRGRELPRRRHPGRQQRARAHLRLGQPARDARLRRGQDRHQQGHARQLVRRLHRPLHDRRLGRQRERRGDARRQRRQRRGAGLAARSPRTCMPSAPSQAPLAAGRRRRPARRLRFRARGRARGAVPRGQRACGAARERRGRAAPSATASPARAMAASSRSIRTSRRRRSASPSRASAACGASTAVPSARGEQLRWAPWPGRHRLELVAQRAADVAERDFEVRGAGVKAAEDALPLTRGRAQRREQAAPSPRR